MKPTRALAAGLISVRDGAATEASTGTAARTPTRSPGVGGPMRRALRVAAVVSLAACGGGADPTEVPPDNTGSIRGTVTDNTGATVANAAVALTGNAQAARTANSGNDGVYTFANVPPGTYTLAVTPPTGFTIGASGTASVTVSGGAEANASPFVLDLAPVAAGEWGLRAGLLAANSEFALAESNGKIYVLGGYPSSRVTVRTVQIYDIASNRWQLGPQLPQPNNHGMAAAVNGKIYLIGGQLTADQEGYVDTVYELDPALGTWVAKAPMPTLRSGGVAVVHGGKIYVAGGRVPRGSDFAVYDPAADRWEALPELPTQRNHITGAAINGRIHIVGGRLGNGLSPLKTDAHEVFDPQTRTWTSAAPMLSARSGINGVMAQGCFHVWGGEAPTGMTPQHEYYDPRTNRWASLPDMPIPIHGVVGSAFVDGLIWVTGGGTQIGGSFGSLHNQVYRPAVSCE